MLIKSKHSNKHRHKQEEFPILRPRSCTQLLLWVILDIFRVSTQPVWTDVDFVLGWSSGGILSSKIEQNLPGMVTSYWGPWWFSNVQPENTTLETALLLSQKICAWKLNCWWLGQSWSKVSITTLKWMCTVGGHQQFPPFYNSAAIPSMFLTYSLTKLLIYTKWI